MHLDLNLLTALDVLIEEASVSAAADRLHLSAPAMSRTLGRIRRATGDQILVRTGRSMTRTPHALAIREQVHLLVQQAQEVLAPDRVLDLATLDRVFTVQCHDAITTAIGPDLLVSVHALAPNVRLRLLAEAGVDTPDLRRGEVDLEIGAAQAVLPEIRSEVLGSDDLVVAYSPGHRSADGDLTMTEYVGATHLTVSRRGRLRDPIDDLLEARGLSRQVVAAAPTSTAALSIVSRSSFLAVVPERTCDAVVRGFGLRTSPLPFEVPPVPVICAWHQRYENDRAHAWLRAQVGAALSRLAP